MDIGERIQERLEAAGFSQAELARRVGVSQPTINNLIHRSKVGSKHLHRIARELGTSAEYLAGETDDPSIGALPMPTADEIAQQLGLVMIPEVDMSFGLGATFLEDNPATKFVPFRQDWLQRALKGKPADVFMTSGDGDSMMPTILDEDMVIVNRADRKIEKAEKIWAVSTGGLGSLKRVRRLANGTWELNSDNPNVRPEYATDDELNVVGRVIWIGRSH